MRHNPLPAITGRVCPHTCETDCARGEFDEAVSIREVERHLEMLQAAGVDPKWVRFEITESAMMKEPEKLIGTLRELRALGSKILLDDFGTGHSSFARLRTLPVTGIKIDKAFVAGVAWDPVAQSLIAAQVAIAEALGIEVLAEGIETEEERAAWKGLSLMMLQLTARLSQGPEHITSRTTSRRTVVPHRVPRPSTSTTRMRLSPACLHLPARQELPSP